MNVISRFDYPVLRDYYYIVSVRVIKGSRLITVKTRTPDYNRTYAIPYQHRGICFQAKDKNFTISTVPVKFSHIHYITRRYLTNAKIYNHQYNKINRM